MPSSNARRERRRMQFGHPSPEPANGVALPSVLPASPSHSSSASPADGVALPDSALSPPASPGSDYSTAGATTKAPSKQAKKTGTRRILFVGNLPFSATTKGIETHFASVKPSSVRHATDKATGRSRGFAFLEFDDVKRMEACLKGWHHSVYREEQGGGDGSSAAVDEGGDESGVNTEPDAASEARKYARAGWRKINVELTYVRLLHPSLSLFRCCGMAFVFLLSVNISSHPSVYHVDGKPTSQGTSPLACP